MLLTLDRILCSLRHQPLGMTLSSGACLLLVVDEVPMGTQILSVIARLEGDASCGTILYNRVDVSLSLREYLSQVCYMPPIKPAFDPCLTVEESLTFWGSMYHCQDSVLAVARACGLHGYLNRKAIDLSKAERRLLLFAQTVLLTNAPIWLLDNPFSDLENEHISLILNLIKIRCSQQGIVIFTCCNAMRDKIKHLMEEVSLQSIQVVLAEYESNSI